MHAYKTILVGIDFSARDALAVRTATAIAGHFAARRVHLTHVAPPYPAWALAELSGAAFSSAIESGLDSAKRALGPIAVPTDVDVTREVRTGAVTRELVASAREANTDLIVIASRQRGSLGRFVLGSVASALVRAAPCPVLVVGIDRPLELPIRKVLAAIDTSPISAKTVEHAVAFAARKSGRVRVVSVFDLAHALEPIAERAGIPYGELLRSHESRYWARVRAIAEPARDPNVELTIDVPIHHDPKSAILDAVKKNAPELAVIGTSGHNAWDRMVLGSTATHVLAEASCPVLVVPFAPSAELGRTVPAP